MRLFITTLIAFILLVSANRVLAHSLPEVSLLVEESQAYGTIINPCYANLLTDTSALGLEIAFGAKEFRLGSTWVNLFQNHHLIKLTAEYLSQQNQFTFLQGPSLLWNVQHAIAGNYSYLFVDSLVSSINLMIYQAHSRDDSLPTIYEFGDNVSILYRNVKGSAACGAMAGIIIQPWCLTKITTNIFYDAVSYNNVAETRPNRSGLGMGVSWVQSLANFARIEFEATHREIYNQYIGKVTWLIFSRPKSHLEISIRAQHTQGNLPEPNENRLGLLLTYRWNLPDIPKICGNKSMAEEILDSATKPLLRMPQILVARDQMIVN